MNNRTRGQTFERGFRGKLPHRFRELLHELLFHTHKGLGRPDFLRQAADILRKFSACDSVFIRIDEGEKVQRCSSTISSGGAAQFECVLLPREEYAARFRERAGVFEEIVEAVLGRKFSAAPPFLTRTGSFWTGDSVSPILLRGTGETSKSTRTLVIGGEFQSLALIPFPVDDEAKGILFLGSRSRDFIGPDDIQLYEAAAETLGVSLAHQSAQWALRERVKELTCLYGVARATQRPGISTDQLLNEVVELLPPGWLYPEIASARIILNKRAFVSKGFVESPYRQSSEIVVDGESKGTVEIHYREQRPNLDEGPFLKEERNLINAVAETLGVALSYGGAQSALRERVKELTCLHGIAKLAQRSEITRELLLQGIVALLPPGWQYPEITSARIVLDGAEFATKAFEDNPWKQTSPIRVKGRERGRVEVCYSREMPELYEGPFLEEERNLINEIARQIGLIIERKEAEEEKARLEEQLRHADRLATIGQLAAGAAHEINEPLGSVLGFAELAKNCPDLPEQAALDLEKIINAALHAREVIKKLMIFARQMPTWKSWIDVNELIREGLLFLDSRCKQENIKLVRALDEELPQIHADGAQLHQVLVNLAVNAIQAMPDGGTLRISTSSMDDFISLIVEDTGTGMSEKIVSQIFNPFFTTKGVGQGTGLGLSVVHGIVTAHGGTIHVTSEIGKGSRFEVRLPIVHEEKQERDM